MKNFLLLFILTIVFCSCSENNKPQPNNLDISKLDLSNLDLGLNEDQIINIDVNNINEIKSFSSQLLKEMGQYLIDINAPESVSAVVQLSIDKTNNQIIIHSQKGNSSGPQTENTLPILISTDEALNNCPEGWTNEGRCYSQSCVEETVTNSLTENINGAGDCSRIQVSRGTLSATVCSQGC